MDNNAALGCFVGRTIKEIIGLKKDSEQVIINFTDGSSAEFYHEQDCCEQVYLADFETDLKYLIGSTVQSAYESSNKLQHLSLLDTQTWTFYHINTDKFSLFMRWMGESNGYYSEKVSVKFKF